jgi:hypothetical protein
MNMSQVDLPDFEQMMEVATRISELAKRKLLLDLALKKSEADIALKVMYDETYFQKGKPPSMSFVESTYMVLGLNGELLDVRREYCETVAELERVRMAYDIMKMKVDVYRTESANSRMATL